MQDREQDLQALCSQRTLELAESNSTLTEREEEIQKMEGEWKQRQDAAKEHWEKVAAEVREHKLLIRQQQAQLQRENELSVVQRIRTQRELREREEQLNEREKELIRREIQIESAFRRLPRDVSAPETDQIASDDSLSDSTLLAASDFVDILDKAIGQDEK